MPLAQSGSCGSSGSCSRIQAVGLTSSASASRKTPRIYRSLAGRIQHRLRRVDCRGVESRSDRRGRRSSEVRCRRCGHGQIAHPSRRRGCTSRPGSDQSPRAPRGGAGRQARRNGVALAQGGEHRLPADPAPGDGTLLNRPSSYVREPIERDEFVANRPHVVQRVDPLWENRGWRAWVATEAAAGWSCVTNRRSAAGVAQPQAAWAGNHVDPGPPLPQATPLGPDVLARSGTLDQRLGDASLTGRSRE